MINVNELIPKDKPKKVISKIRIEFPVVKEELLDVSSIIEESSMELPLPDVSEGSTSLDSIIKK